VGLGCVAKNVMYLLTPSLSASCLQSLLPGLGGSSRHERFCLTAKGILKGADSACVEPSEEQPEEEVVTLPLPPLPNSDTRIFTQNVKNL